MPYFNNYFIRFTKTGYIYEIHGSNNNLKINPVECLDVQGEFIESFHNKIPNLFTTEIKQFPNKLKSKTKEHEIVYSLNVLEKFATCVKIQTQLSRYQL